jgi:hypothetical protein
VQIDAVALAERFTPRAVPVEPWDQKAAVKLEYQADTLVSELGVDGRDERIQARAALAVEAHLGRDMLRLRATIAEFVRMVREVVQEQTQRSP